MPRRDKTRPTMLGVCFATLLCFAGLVAAHSRSAGPALRPNVFLITIDTLRTDHLHCYGYSQIKTPALDSLAEQGILFRQAFTPSPITNASHTSILTGLLPSSHGVSDFGVALDASHPTLASELQKQGYHTAAFIGAVVLDSKQLAPGLDRGFEYYDNFPEHPKSNGRWDRLERRGMEVEQHVEKWLSAHSAAPYFVWMHLYDPHDPYEPPAPYSEAYKHHLYDGEIAYADSAVGSLIKFLKQKGLYDNSVIVVVGDHGEGLGEHQEETHGIFLYDSTTHVPLIVKLPKNAKAGKEIQAQVRTIDIMPTLLDLLGINAPAKQDGASLAPLIADMETLPRTVLAETDYPLRFGWAPLRAVRSDNLKFIEAPAPELYDLKADAHETQNAYAPWDARVQKLRMVLKDSFPQKQSVERGATSAGTVDELHALGYLGAADVGSSTDVPEPTLLPDPKDKIQEQNLLHTAMMSAEDGRIEDARAAMAKVLSIDPVSVTALVQIGKLEIAADNTTQACEHLLRAYTLRPQDPTVALVYAEALERNHNLPRAREVLEAGLKTRSGEFALLFQLGRLYLHANDPNSAVVQLEAAQLLQPDNVEVSIELAKALIQEENFAAAVEILNDANAAAKNPRASSLLSASCAKLDQQAPSPAAAHAKSICKANLRR